MYQHMKRNSIPQVSVIALLVLLLSFGVVSCTKKRCLCLTERKAHQTARSYEDLGSHKNCSELDKQWDASDSTAHIIKKTCTPE